MPDFVYPASVLPELNYPKPPEKSCGSCCNGQVWNPGASYPSHQCLLIEYLYDYKGIENGNPQVDSRWGTCKFHGVPLESIKALVPILFPTKKTKGDTG